MLRTLTAVAALLPGLALAQVTVTETSDFENGDDEIINLAECAGTVLSRFAISWNLGTSTLAPQGTIRISDTPNCPVTTEVGGTTAKTATLDTFTTATGQISPNRSAQDLVGLLGLACDNPATLRTLNICAVVGASGTAAANTISTSIRLDSQTPSPPRILSVTPGEKALDVSWEASSGANRYRVEATPVGGGPTERSSETTDTSRRISRLVNGTTYDVGVVALSIGGNPSASSTKLQGTPIEVGDFWRLYQERGGREEGGCATGGTGGLAVGSLLGLLPLLLRRRRRS